MQLHRVALGLALPLLSACDQTAPVAPDISADLQPVFCETFAEGRMTGGGVVRMTEVGGEQVKITNGFTLHCDVTLSNNLEINWAGNQWHLEKESLDWVECTDEPGVSPEPPPAPFDTFWAHAYGRYNGLPGYEIDFTLQDAGEPGGKMDKAGMTITSPGGDVVLQVPFDFTVHGNLQAHYDQPHGSNVNR